MLEELQRIRTIESRLKQIQERDSLVKDVIVKEVILLAKVIFSEINSTTITRNLYSGD